MTIYKSTGIRQIHIKTYLCIYFSYLVPQQCGSVCSRNFNLKNTLLCLFFIVLVSAAQQHQQKLQPLKVGTQSIIAANDFLEIS